MKKQIKKKSGYDVGFDVGFAVATNEVNKILNRVEKYNHKELVQRLKELKAKEMR